MQILLGTIRPHSKTPVRTFTAQNLCRCINTNWDNTNWYRLKISNSHGYCFESIGRACKRQVWPRAIEPPGLRSDDFTCLQYNKPIRPSLGSIYDI